jgi:hypothetical protein
MDLVADEATDDLLSLFILVVDGGFVIGVVLLDVRCLFFLILIIVVIFVLGKDDEVHGMNLRHFELRVAFAAAHNFAFFDFVFVQVDVRVAFRALGHGNLSFRV